MKPGTESYESEGCSLADGSQNLPRTLRNKHDKNLTASECVSHRWTDTTKNVRENELKSTPFGHMHKNENQMLHNTEEPIIKQGFPV